MQAHTGLDALPREGKIPAGVTQQPCIRFSTVPPLQGWLGHGGGLAGHPLRTPLLLPAFTQLGLCQPF